MYPLETDRDHTRPQSPHCCNPTRWRFIGFAKAILRRRRHLNPSNSNSLDRIHPRLRVSHLHYDMAEDPPGDDECIHYSCIGFPRRHPKCNYILVNRNHVHPRTPHPTLTPNITTNVLFRIKYYHIGPRSTIHFFGNCSCVSSYCDN
jgi:hypothetical protein